MNKKTENKKVIYEVIPYILIAIGVILLIKHAKFSFCASDESFYASTTNRFLKGDAVFVHEWFPTQLVSIMLVPVQGLYLKIAGSNDAVLLYMRYVYIVFSTISSVCVYLLLSRKHGKFPASCCSLYTLFYAHLNIATMSYYTLSYQCFVLSMLILIFGYDSVNRNRIHRPLDVGIKAIAAYVIGGVVFAAFVLSLPSFALVYFLIVLSYVVIFVIDKCLKGGVMLKLHKLVYELFPVFIYSLAGIVALAVPVLVYVLPKSGILGIINNLGYVLSDEEHITSLVAPFKKFFLAVIDVYDKDVYLSVLLVVVAVIIFILRDIIKKPFKYYTVVCNLIFVTDLIMLIYYVTKSVGHTGYLSTAICLFAFPLFFITEKKDWLLFWLLFIGGLIFSMVYSYSSNGDLYVLSIGHSISALAGICFIWDYNLNNNKTSAFLEIVIATILITFVVLTATLRFINIYRDAPITMLTEKVDEGPAKGLYTTQEHKQQYDQILSVIRENEGEGNVFFTKLLPWGYLATDRNCGAPTTWRTKFSSDRLRLYYEENPDKVPDIIFVLPKDAGKYDTCGDVESDPTPNENEFGGALETIVKDGYQKTEDEGIIIYKKES